MIRCRIREQANKLSYASKTEHKRRRARMNGGVGRILASTGRDIGESGSANAPKVRWFVIAGFFRVPTGKGDLGGRNKVSRVRTNQPRGYRFYLKCRPASEIYLSYQEFPLLVTKGQKLVLNISILNMPRRTARPPDSPPDGYRTFSPEDPDAWPLLVAFDLEWVFDQSLWSDC